MGNTYSVISTHKFDAKDISFIDAELSFAEKEYARIDSPLKVRNRLLGVVAWLLSQSYTNTAKAFGSELTLVNGEADDEMKCAVLSEGGSATFNAFSGLATAVSTVVVFLDVPEKSSEMNYTITVNGQAATEGEPVTLATAATDVTVVVEGEGVINGIVVGAK